MNGSLFSTTIIYTHNRSSDVNTALHNCTITVPVDIGFDFGCSERSCKPRVIGVSLLIETYFWLFVWRVLTAVVCLACINSSCLFGVC